MPYLVILAATLAALACVWLPELRRRPAGSHACDDAAPAGWAPYERHAGRHEPRHAKPRFYLPVGNYVRRVIASYALVLVVAWHRPGAVAQTAA